jgi:eukaryotic-like serine/threonine-protein kinase
MMHAVLPLFLLLMAPTDRAGAAEIDWVTIPGGRFQMGIADAVEEEAPLQKVSVPTFQIAATEVTVAQYRACVQAGGCAPPNDVSRKPNCNWGRAGRDDHPVNCVDWDQALAFCRWVGGRLPTESEWEYAARAGTTTRFSTGACLGTEQANFNGEHPLEGCPAGTYRGETTPVRSFAANPWGLYDLHGNVWEWVMDSFRGYTEAPPDGSAWMSRSIYSRRIYRGGSWYNVARNCRSAQRGKGAPSVRNYGIGFRPARPAP